MFADHWNPWSPINLADPRAWTLATSNNFGHSNIPLKQWYSYCNLIISHPWDQIPIGADGDANTEHGRIEQSAKVMYELCLSGAWPTWCRFEVKQENLKEAEDLETLSGTLFRGAVNFGTSSIIAKELIIPHDWWLWTHHHPTITIILSDPTIISALSAFLGDADYYVPFVLKSLSFIWAWFKLGVLKNRHAILPKWSSTRGPEWVLFFPFSTNILSGCIGWWYSNPISWLLLPILSAA